jgi:hypothetical protein
MDSTSRTDPSRRRRARRRLVVLTAIGAALVTAACGPQNPGAAPATTTTAVSTGSNTTDFTLDTGHDYGNRYADGILPVGDGHYSLTTPAVGKVYLCHAGDPNGGGADTRGPWFSPDGTTYDINAKAHVQGDVHWDGQYSVQVFGDVRTITTNDLPEDHPTGQFPISPTDPAYQYDRNPNSIQDQALTYRLDATPEVNTTPTCMGGESGVMNTGVALFDGFDAGLRDAGAWEVQDDCSGHPQVDGEYHYHTLSSCITDVAVTDVIGWALDGFPITGPTIAPGNVLTTADLDECHGITSPVTIDGVSTNTYHYVMTEDFPYSVSCFRGNPIAAPHA